MSMRAHQKQRRDKIARRALERRITRYDHHVSAGMPAFEPVREYDSVISALNYESMAARLIFGTEYPDGYRLGEF